MLTIFFVLAFSLPIYHALKKNISNLKILEDIQALSEFKGLVTPIYLFSCTQQ